MDEGKPHLKMEEVESLVQQLYQPGAPERISKIQETLHKLQRSSQGWLMAEVLLSSKDDNAKFFGALTFTVKLNTNWQSLSTHDARALLQKLIGWLIHCLENNAGAVVVRKLCLTLVTYFLYFSAEWTTCVKHLMYCLCTNQNVQYENLEDAIDVNVLVQTLSHQKASAVLSFAASLVDEISKVDLNSLKQHTYQQDMKRNIDAVVLLMARYINTGLESIQDPKIRQESLGCLQSWITFSERVYNDNAIIQPLQTLSEPAMMCLANDDLYETTVEMFSDVFANYSKFVRSEDYTLLYSLFQSPWGRARYDRLVQGDCDHDSLQFGQLMLAFGDARVQHLAETAATDPQSSQFLEQMIDLLAVDGVVVHEDEMFEPALEFWSTFLLALTDEAYTDNAQHPPWVTEAIPYAMQVIEKCWLKIQYPPAVEFDRWDKNDQNAFKLIRGDVSDLVQQVHLLIGGNLFALFTDSLLKSVQDRDMGSQLEAALYCLSQLPDSIANHEEDQYLDRIFGSELLRLLGGPDSGAPLRTKQSLFMLINHYSATRYFQRPSGQKYLPVCLNFMVSLIDSPKLGRLAAMSIYGFCGPCRTVLIPELPAFLQQYSRMRSEPSLDGQVKESFIGAVSFIIEALPYDIMKVAPLQELLDFVDTDHDRSRARESTLDAVNAPRDVVSANDYAERLERSLVALRCLAKIGLGLRKPDDQPIDLDKSDIASEFWTRGNGAVVQQRIVQIIKSILDDYKDDGDVVEESCLVFRAGFTELEPGPFVFQPATIADFLLSFGPDAKCIGTVMKTACTFISSYNKMTERIDEIAAALLKWVSQLLHQLGEPAKDPEIAQHGIDFLFRLIFKYLNVLIDHQPPSSLETLFTFTLRALEGGDPLPKFTAAEFWASFIALKGQDEPAQSSIDHVLQYFGPSFARILIRNFGGNAARSELDKLCEPLKKMVINQVHSRTWLQAALMAVDFPSEKATEKDKMTFLQKIMNLRGGKATNQIVREFWLQCRGSIFAYAS